MATHSSVRLSLELEPTGHRIRGSVRDELGQEHRFSSWLGLLQLLEAGCGRAERTHTQAERRAP